MKHKEPSTQCWVFWAAWGQGSAGHTLPRPHFLSAKAGASGDKHRVAAQSRHTAPAQHTGCGRRPSLPFPPRPDHPKVSVLTRAHGLHAGRGTTPPKARSCPRTKRKSFSTGTGKVMGVQPEGSTPGPRGALPRGLGVPSRAGTGATGEQQPSLKAMTSPWPGKPLSTDRWCPGRARAHLWGPSRH